MRLNDLAPFAVGLSLGILIGIVATAAVYGAAAVRQADAEQKEADETVQRLQYELQEKQARIDKYLEEEDNKRRALEQPDSEKPPPPPAKREAGTAAPAPAPTGLRPPREFGSK
jgi:hypothetical protein